MGALMQLDAKRIQNLDHLRIDSCRRSAVFGYRAKKYSVFGTLYIKETLNIWLEANRIISKMSTTSATAL